MLLETMSEKLNQFGRMVSELWADVRGKLFSVLCILFTAVVLSYISRFIIHKNGKNKFLHHFYQKVIFLGCIIKKLRKEGPGSPAPIFYEVSIVVL